MPKRLTKEESTATDTFAKFVAEPFETGYGHTIGNSLRRVLLSSLEGAAITSIKVDGAQHEFTTIDGVNTAPNLAYLTQVYPANALAANLAKSLFYDTTTKKLTYQGVLTDQVLALLQNLQIQVYINGIPQVNPDGSPVLQTVAVFDAATASKLQQQYALEISFVLPK